MTIEVIDLRCDLLAITIYSECTDSLYRPLGQNRK